MILLDTLQICYTLINVIAMGENLALFYRYLKYCHKLNTIVFIYQAPSYEPNFTELAWFPSKLAHLSMLFIPEMACTACCADHLKD